MAVRSHLATPDGRLLRPVTGTAIKEALAACRDGTPAVVLERDDGAYIKVLGSPEGGYLLEYRLEADRPLYASSSLASLEQAADTMLRFNRRVPGWRRGLTWTDLTSNPRWHPRRRMPEPRYRRLLKLAAWAGGAGALMLTGWIVLGLPRNTPLGSGGALLVSMALLTYAGASIRRGVVRDSREVYDVETQPWSFWWVVSVVLLLGLILGVMPLTELVRWIR